jgi:2-oxo-3-hexenedioate decarboxylase
MERYQSIAQFLYQAEKERREVVRVTKDQYPDMTVDDAYHIQRQLVNLKLEEGRNIIGLKMGFTSKAKMKQMNVYEPIYGYLLDDMLVEDGSEIKFSELIHPRAEAEIAFILGEDLSGPGVSAAQVMAATEYVLPAIEIIDSRYENFNFTLPDVIADNASSARLVLGSKLTPPWEQDLEVAGTTLWINGELKDLGAGAAVLGHPANAIARLANMLSRSGEKLKSGQIILSGGITGAASLKLGDFVQAKIGGLGEVSFSVKE